MHGLGGKKKKKTTIEYEVKTFSSRSSQRVRPKARRQGRRSSRGTDEEQREREAAECIYNNAVVCLIRRDLYAKPPEDYKRLPVVSDPIAVLPVPAGSRPGITGSSNRTPINNIAGIRPPLPVFPGRRLVPQSLPES